MKRIDYLNNVVPEPKEEPPKEAASFSKLKKTGDPNWTVTELQAIPVSSRPQDYWIGIDRAAPIRNDIGGVMFERPWGTLETTSNTVTDPTDPRSLLGATIYGGRITDVTQNVDGYGNSMAFTTRFDDGIYIRTILDSETIVRSNMPLMQLLTRTVEVQRRNSLADRPFEHRPIRSMVDGFDFGFELEKPKPNIFKRILNRIFKR